MGRKSQGVGRRAWRRVRPGALVVVGWCAAVLGAPLPGHAQTFGYTASVFVARSTYEIERATSLYLFNGVDVSGGPVRLSASIPLIRQRITPLASLADPTVVPAPRTNAGFGDPLIRLDVRVVDDRPRDLQIGVAGSVKGSG